MNGVHIYIRSHDNGRPVFSARLQEALVQAWQVWRQQQYGVRFDVFLGTCLNEDCQIELWAVGHEQGGFRYWATPNTLTCRRQKNGAVIFEVLILPATPAPGARTGDRGG